MKKILILVSVAAWITGLVNAQEVSLRYKLNPGTAFTSETNVHTTMVQKVMGINQEITMDMTMALIGKVTGEKDHIYSIKYRYTKLKITTTSSTYTVSIDTDGPDSPQNNMLKVLTGKSFTVYMDNRGRINDIEGLEKIFAGVDSLSDMDEETRQQYKSSLEETFSKDFFLQNFEQSSVLYPENPVKIGQSWRYNLSTTSSDVSLNLQNTATLKDVSGKMILVRVASLIDTPANDTINIGGNSGRISMTGHQISEVRINRSNGLITESNVSQKITGKLVITNLPETDEDMEIPMTMSSRINVTLTITR
ncbi:MAG TPA: DUF6263 family protein [Bacteroidales bacterium]|nr:DUF6263 family protein [Bacteroidales bacterium]